MGRLINTIATIAFYECLDPRLMLVNQPQPADLFADFH